MNNSNGVKFIRVRGRIVPIMEKKSQTAKVSRVEAAKAGLQIGANIGAKVGSFFGSIQIVPIVTNRTQLIKVVTKGLITGAAKGAFIGGSTGAVALGIGLPRKINADLSHVENGQYKAKLFNPISTGLSIVGGALLAKSHGHQIAYALGKTGAAIIKKLRIKNSGLKVVK